MSGQQEIFTELELTMLRLFNDKSLQVNWFSEAFSPTILNLMKMGVIEEVSMCYSITDMGRVMLRLVGDDI